MGIEIFYIGSNLGDGNSNDIRLRWVGATFCSWRKLMIFSAFVYELYHHWNDLFYIFVMPHWNWIVSLVLLVSFWAPLWVLVMGCVMAKSGGIDPFQKMFVDPEGNQVRKYARLVATNVIHLTF